MVIHMYYAGINIAKKQHEACAIDDEGIQVLAMPIPNTQAGAVRFLTALRKCVGDNTDSVAFCLEATGHYWLPTYCFLSDQGYRVHVINPIPSDAVRNLYSRKTDCKDTFILADLLRMNKTIEFIENQISDLEDAIKLAMEELESENVPDYLEGEHCHAIQTILGIGPILVAAIGEVGDIHRLSNAHKLVAYAGIDATTKQSGEFTSTRNRISKRGSPELRLALWLAATSARRFNPDLDAYYETKKQRGKHPMVATGAVVRRLVHIVYSVWTLEKPYDPEYKWSPPGSVD
jgi:transposase